MKTTAYPRSARGFSLLEVLVAIVILSVGLLALASLQLSLIRASNDTKAQSTAMSLAKEKVETLSSYQIMGGTTSACYSPASTPVAGQSSCYRMINTQNSPSETINNVGGINYTRTTVVDRFIYRPTGTPSGFVTAAQGGFTNIMLNTGVKAACAACLPGKEFKRVLVTVSWSDAQGTTRRVQVEEVIPGLDPSDSIAVNSTSGGGAPRQAIAIIPNQATVQGVIPIAIGNGSDTAATNPRPVIVSQGNNSTTVETRFDIYTYAAINGDSAVAQSRVETAVVGCKCTLGTGTQTTFRPTYWNGFKYVVPTTRTSPVSAQASGQTQSTLCTACCRDHQDPSGQVAPLFDPRRSVHNHYLKTDLATPVTSGGSSYHEACRLIRVDGIFRVAAEPYNDHYGLLATIGVANSTKTSCANANACTAAETLSAFPATGTGSVTANYQTFVLNYLKARFVDVTAYNTVIDPSTVTGYSTLQTPATATIMASTSPQFMHARGLYIDHLHTDAIAAIASAKATCVATSCTASQLQTAVFKLLPFTSINTTEVAGPGWASNLINKVEVSKLDDLSATLNVGLPAAGRALFNSGNNGDAITTTTSMQRTSAGLAVLDPTTEIVFPSSELTNNIMSDTQPYSIVGPVTPPAESFSLVLTGSTFLSTVFTPSPWNVSFGNGTTYKACTSTAGTLTPYTCTTLSQIGAFTLGGLTYIKLSNYNRSFNKQVFNGCSTTSADKTDMPYIRNFNLNTTTPSAVTSFETSPNTGAETITASINPVTAGSTVTFDMTGGNYLCPSNWSTFIVDNAAGTEKPVAGYPSGSCTTGSPSSRKPIWSTTYGACPVNFVIP